MQCPIRSAVIELEGITDDRNILPCTEEKCAWWDKLAPGCAVKSIECQLDGIRSALFDIVEMLRPKEQDDKLSAMDRYRKAVRNQVAHE